MNEILFFSTIRHTEKNRWRPNLPDNTSGVSVEVEEVDEECDEERTNNGNIQLDRYIKLKV